MIQIDPENPFERWIEEKLIFFGFKYTEVFVTSLKNHDETVKFFNKKKVYHYWFQVTGENSADLIENYASVFFIPSTEDSGLTELQIKMGVSGQGRLYKGTEIMFVSDYTL
jgi:hypothetical protein